MGTWDMMTPETMKRLEKLNEDGWDLYFIPNQVRSSFVGVKPADRDIVVYSNFVVDYDPTVPGTHFDISNTPIPEPCFVFLYTGNGYQLHYRLAPNAFSVPEIRSRVAAHIRTISCPPGYRIDTSTTDASRMVRMPGSINWKTGVRGWAILMATSAYYPVPPPAPALPETEQLTNVDLTNLSAIVTRLTGRAERFLLRGVNSKVEGRHSAAYAAAACLCRLGVRYKEAVELVRAGGALCTPPLEESESERAVKQAYKATM